MQNKWHYFEKGTALFLTLLGVLELTVDLIFLNGYLEFIRSSPLIPDYSFSIIILSYHPKIVISLIIFISGLLLFNLKRTGWILSVSSCIIHIGVITKAFFLSVYTNEMLLISGLFITTFLTILIILFQEPIKTKINPKSKDWLIGLFVVSAVLMDYFYFTV